MIEQTLGHYRIVEKIGTGGMGIVYRAHDSQLDRDVALKVLLPGTLSDDAARKQFRREALALAKLNHPNIETVFEFNTEDDTDFLAMELIPGVSLSSKLSSGALTEKEAVHQGMQLAEGLAAAHGQGVIHRDLKPGNLFITPEGRLKILDFGLARLLDPKQSVDLTQSITKDTGGVSGTVPYMSPEQLRGLPADARSDIYAAGAVLYEMSTGQRAFAQAQTYELISAILQAQPPAPRKINPHISPDLEAVIGKALEKEPMQRYQTARELHVALEGIASGTMKQAAVAAAKRPAALKWLISAAVLFIIGAGMVIGANLGGLRARMFQALNVTMKSGTAATPVKLRPAVAILGFKNLSGRQDQAWLSTALSELLITEVSAGERLRVIPGESVAKMKVDLSLPDADSYGRETLLQIRRNIGSDYVVLGSYLALGNGQVRLDLRLENADTGEVLDSVSGRGSESQLDGLVSRTGAKLRDELGAGEVTSAEAAQLKASLPANPEAARLYAEGLARVRSFEILAGRELLEKAIAADPNLAIAHAELAGVYDSQGYSARAKEEAQKALALSAGLSREDRMSIQGRFHEINNQWDKAVETYRSLWTLFPDNLSYGLQLASALTSGGKAKDALAVVETMRNLPAPENEDPLIDLREAAAAQSVGDFQRQQAAAARAEVKGRKLGARLLTAHALYTEGWAWSNLGDTKKAMDAAQQSRELYVALGDPGEASGSLTLIGTLLLGNGDPDGASRAYELNLRLEREKGNVAGMAFALNDIASVMLVRGELAGAARALSQARSAFREVRDGDSEAYAANNLAAVLLEQGNLPGAKKATGESLAIFRQIGDKDGIAYALINSGNTFDTSGDLARAKKYYIDAQTVSSEIGDQSISAHALDGLAGIAAEQGDLDGARTHLLDAIGLWDKLGVKLSSAESRMALADVFIHQGNIAAAEASARLAIEEFRVEKATDDSIAVAAVLARTLLAEGKTEEAGKEIASVAEFADKTQNLGVRLQYDIAASRVRAASGHRPAAEATLKSALARANKNGLISYALESRLALSEIELKTAGTSSARAHLAALEKDATARGYLLIASEAASLSHN